MKGCKFLYLCLFGTTTIMFGIYKSNASNDQNYLTSKPNGNLHGFDVLGEFNYKTTDGYSHFFGDNKFNVSCIEIGDTSECENNCELSFINDFLSEGCTEEIKEKKEINKNENQTTNNTTFRTKEVERKEITINELDNAAVTITHLTTPQINSTNSNTNGSEQSKSGMCFDCCKS